MHCPGLIAAVAIVGVVSSSCNPEVVGIAGTVAGQYVFSLPARLGWARCESIKRNAFRSDHVRNQI